MKMYVGLTDNRWFRFLRDQQPDEVNFWQPNTKNHFRAIQPGDWFLFKLHAPDHFIVGGGIFIKQTFLPASLETSEGRELYHEVERRLAGFVSTSGKDMIMEESVRYGEPQMVFPRLGQGGFRVMVTEAYHRRCAMTGEKTLPVLDASHIRPYAQEGPHATSNGLLLRQDIHTLFDHGYLTVNENLIIEVSRRIRDDYGNGKDYYAYHGKSLSNLPDQIEERPSRAFLIWHNQNVYVG